MWVVLIGYLRNIVSSKVIGIERIIIAIFTNWLRRTWLRLKQIKFFFFLIKRKRIKLIDQIWFIYVFTLYSHCVINKEFLIVDFLLIKILTIFKICNKSGSNNCT